MNEADKFLEAFIKENPEVQSGQLTLDELNSRLARFQDNLNSRPLDEFDGLNPTQMTALLYNPLSNECPLRLTEDCGQYIDKVPLFQLSELLLSEIEKQGGIKLTSKGNLPVRICELLFEQQLIKWKYMEYLTIVREEEIPYIGPLKQCFLDLGIAKKIHNKLSLTRNGVKFMKESKTERFMTLLLYFGSHFHWGNFYNIADGGRAGQLGWAYSLWLLQKYGDEPGESQFYSSKIIKAFEKDLREDTTGEVAQKRMDDYHYAYGYRLFENFANWFGLVNMERRKVSHSFHDQLIVTKTTLFDELFQSAK